EAVALAPHALVLSGRCYERETVPYKAIDGVVDSLSRMLARATPAEAADYLPAGLAALARVFPVLRRGEAIAKVSSPAPVASDPQELRRRAFAAMRELLARVAKRRPLVVVIDDLHWADDDSLSLLREILRPPDAPAILLIATA